MRTFHWDPVPGRDRREIQQCVIDGHTLTVRRVHAREYVAGIDGLNMDRIFHTMKYAKAMLRNYYAMRFPPCNHKNRKIISEQRTLTRYKCNDCGREWDVDSSG
jgi:hypothetical protein